MKKINQRGVAHHGLIAIIIVLAVINGAGYVVWKSQSSNVASADNWTDLSGVGGESLKDDSRIMACKYEISSGSNKGWGVRAQAYNENYIGDFNGIFEVKRDGSTVGSITIDAKPYSIGSQKKTNFIIEPGDTWTGYKSFRAGAIQSFGGPWTFDKIADC